MRHNSHQSLDALGPMAYAVLRVILERLRAEGRLLDDTAPPFQTADGRLVRRRARRASAVRDAAGSRI